jgi:hypothetical protein
MQHSFVIRDFLRQLKIDEKYGKGDYQFAQILVLLVFYDISWLKCEEVLKQEGSGKKGNRHADWGLEGGPTWEHAVRLRQWLKGCWWIGTRG